MEKEYDNTAVLTDRKPEDGNNIITSGYVVGDVQSDYALSLTVDDGLEVIESSVTYKGLGYGRYSMCVSLPVSLPGITISITLDGSNHYYPYHCALLPLVARTDEHGDYISPWLRPSLTYESEVGDNTYKRRYPILKALSMTEMLTDLCFPLVIDAKEDGFIVSVNGKKVVSERYCDRRLHIPPMMLVKGCDLKITFSGRQDDALFYSDSEHDPNSELLIHDFKYTQK